jgi:hypothetical protein
MSRTSVRRRDIEHRAVSSVDELRARSTARCERLVGRSALLETADIPWERAGDVALDDDVVNTLVFMRDVEGFTYREFGGLSAHPATLADPLLVAFLAAWQAEEREHARALDRFLSAYASQRDVDLPAMQPAPPSEVPFRERLLVFVSRPIGHVVTAAHMTWGATNELLTMHGYRILAARTRNPVLHTLLGRIADQEARHYSFYVLQAEWRLAASPLARLALRRMLRRSWTPVGVGDGYKPLAEFGRVFRYLSSGDTGRRTIRMMDARISSLPGFGDLGIYSRVAAATSSGSLA